MKLLSSQQFLDKILKIRGGKAALTNLLCGRYRAAGLERLNTNTLLSIHPNLSDRILLAISEIDGERCFIIVDIALNHDYHKATAMRKNDLSELVARGELKSIELEDLERENVEFAELKASASSGAVTQAGLTTEMEIRQMQHFGEQLIELNPTQLKTLKVSLPLLIGGGPGSGKSCSAMQILERLQAEIVDPDERVIYLTRSVRLARKMESDWVLQGGYEQSNYNKVSFMTYEELLDEELWTADNPDRQKALIGKDGFGQWWEQRCQQHSNKRWKKEPLDKIYQEFRLISGYTQKQYLELGKRQSLYNEQEDRAALYRAYNAYQAELERTNKIDTNFYTPPGEKKYRFIVDEARDLSNGQLRNLTRLSKDCSIVCCVDSNQSLEDDESNRDFLLQMFKEESGKKEVSHIELPGSYRCPEKILRVADAILQIKHASTGGLTDKHEASSLCDPEALNASQKEGAVHYITPESDLSTYRQMAQFTSLAVVTDAIYRDEAAKLFQTPLIFTQEEIKGLQFPRVIVYKPFDSPIYMQINQRLPDVLVKKETHRAKHDADRMPEFGPPMNRVFTAITRAQDELIICQRFTRELGRIEHHMKSAAEQSKTIAEAAVAETPDLALWKQTFWNLFANGHKKQALSVFITKLGRSAAEFEQLVANGCQTHPQQVVESASVAEVGSESSALPPARIEASASVLKTEPSAPSTASKSKKSASAQASHAEATPAPAKNRKKSTSPTTANAANAPAQASETTPSSTTKEASIPPKEAKLFDYANKLILGGLFNEQNVKNLLKHPKANEILNVPVSGKTVYQHILDSEEKMKALLETLKETEYMDKMELYVLSIYPEARRLATCRKEEGPIVLKVLENNLELSAEFTAKQWNSLLPMDSADFSAEAELPLVSLSKTTEGQKALHQRLQQDRSWYDRISIEQLCAICATRTHREQKMPLIYFLCYSEITLGFLIEYLDRNIAFLSDEELNNLGAALSATSPKTCYKDVSTLFLLFNHYARKLDAIFVKNKKLFHHVDWVSLLNKCVPAYGGVGLLYLISQCVVRQDVVRQDVVRQDVVRQDVVRQDSSETTFLASLVEEIPDILKEFSHEIIHHRIKAQKADTEPYITSSFNLLCSNAKNHAILRSIYQETPCLYRQITIDDLCMSCSSDLPERSVMWSLLNKEDGVHFLKDLFTQNPVLCKQISREILFKEISINTQISSIFYSLSATIVSAEVLNKIFESNPDLYKQITIEQLYLRLIINGSTYTPLHNLATLAPGINFLTKLFGENPSLLKQISSEELFRQVAYPDGQITSTFYSLSVNEQAASLLIQIFAANLELYQKITVNDLCLNSRTKVGITYTPLYFLSGTSSGRKFLRDLFEKNPDIFKQIPSEDLCRIFSETASTGFYCSGTSPIYWLVVNQYCRDLLSAWVDCDQNLAQKITSEALFNKRHAQAGEWGNHTAFQGLANSPVLLKKIFDSNPSLYEPVTADELLTISFNNESTKTASAFLSLCVAGLEGMLFLKGLFQRKPSLYAEVSIRKLGVVCHMKSSNQPVSALSCLSRNEEGIEILEDLLLRQPGEYLNITPEALCLVENGSITTQDTLLSFLQTSVAGLAFWRDALKKRPDLKDFLDPNVKSLLEPVVTLQPSEKPAHLVTFSYRPHQKKCPPCLLKKIRPN